MNEKIIESWVEEIYQVAVSVDYASDCVRNVRKALSSARADERARIVEKIRAWKNEGDGPTETDLVLENILKQGRLKPALRR